MAQVNKNFSDDTPISYFRKVYEDSQHSETDYGNISSIVDLHADHTQNCIPENISEMDYSCYDESLAVRRKLMAHKIREYYYNLCYFSAGKRILSRNFKLFVAKKNKGGNSIHQCIHTQACTNLGPPFVHSRTESFGGCWGVAY